jgi:transposase-like protein
MSKREDPRRSFGVDDQPGCPKCGKPMMIIRRTPHSDHGPAYERQSFICIDCRTEIERSADLHGKPHK